MKKIIFFMSILTVTIFLVSCTSNKSIMISCDITYIKVGEELKLSFTTNPPSLKEGMIVKYSTPPDSYATIINGDILLGLSPGFLNVTVSDVNSEMKDSCSFGILEKDVSNNDVFDELVDVMTEPATMDLTDDAYLTYSLSGHDLEYEFYYMQLNIDNDTYVIEFALKDATESIYETGSLSDASGSYEIHRLNQPSGYDEFWGFSLVGNNMELYILYYYDGDGNLVVDEVDQMIFVPSN